jgi:hypothetical protein
VWVDARKLFHLSHVHIQMARELASVIQAAVVAKERD